MSLRYAQQFGNKSISREAMRDWCSGPAVPRDANGKPMYQTEQAHREACDINRIMARYSKDGLIEHVNVMEASFGDCSGSDFKAMVDKVNSVFGRFSEFPSDIRKRFGNDPVRFFEFFDDPANRDEAIKLGLVRSDWALDKDGLGEHVPKDVQEARDAPKNAELADVK